LCRSADFTISLGYTDVWVKVPRNSSSNSEDTVFRVQMHYDKHLVLPVADRQPQIVPDGAGRGESAAAAYPVFQD
jgi:hypothetical protein